MLDLQAEHWKPIAREINRADIHAYFAGHSSPPKQGPDAGEDSLHVSIQCHDYGQPIITIYERFGDDTWGPESNREIVQVVLHHWLDGRFPLTEELITAILEWPGHTYHRMETRELEPYIQSKMQLRMQFDMFKTEGKKP